MITLTLQRIEDSAYGTKTFFFDKPDNFRFVAGQYVALKLNNLVEPDYRAGVRSLSICSSPCEDFIAFTMRQSESGFKKTFWSMQPGDKVSITPPIGKFVLDPSDSREVVFLVGGVGITPVRSMLCEEMRYPSDKRFVLFYANRTKEDGPHTDELKALKLHNLRMIEVFSQEQGALVVGQEVGYIDRALVERTLDKPLESVYYIVGSPSFLEAMENMLRDMGVPEDQWHKDPFTGMESANQK
jgi:ferredoxin-NADP reductase